MTKKEAIEVAKKMTYKEAVRNTIYAKGVRYKKATRIKLQELAEIADKLVLCKDCKNYSVEGKTTQFGWCNALEMPTDEQRFCADGERKKEPLNMVIESLSAEPVCEDTQTEEQARYVAKETELAHIEARLECAEKRLQEDTKDCTKFFLWLLEEIMDEENWEMNAVADGEIIARKLKNLGLLEVKDGYYVRTSLTYGLQNEELVRCKNCIHRQTYKCPMYNEEWYTIDEGDGYLEDDWVVHDYTVDDGYCHLGDTRGGEEE